VASGLEHAANRARTANIITSLARSITLFLTVFVGALPSSALASDPADRVIAVVDGELVLSSEVDLVAAVTEQDPSASRFWTRPVRNNAQRATDAAIVRASAGDVSLYAPTAAEVRERSTAIRRSFDSAIEADAWLAAWGLQGERLDEQVIGRLVVEKFLARTLPVAESDPGWDTAVDALLDELRDARRIRRIGEQR